MKAHPGLKLAALALLAAGGAQAAEPARGAAMQQVNTPSGPMLVLKQPPPPATATAASAPLTDVQPTPSGPMLVLRDPAARSAAAASARTLAKSAMPSAVRAEALPNGAQTLVMPTREATKPPAAALPIVEIDPAKPGTRPGDTPRNDVLYRPLSAASAASAPKR